MPPYRLPDIPHLRLRFALESQDDARLPAYKGSLLRGSFGHALRRAVCAMGPKQPCETCSLQRACVHARLFEVFVGAEPPPFLHGLPAAPRPFVFEPEDEQRDFKAGDLLELDLVLFGEAVTLQAFAVLAVERMAEAGLGVHRHPFVLQRVSYQDADGLWQPGFERGGRRFTEAPAVHLLREPAGADRLRLRFLTPTRIKEGGRFIDRFTFRTLAFRMLRRTLEIAHFHVPGADVDWQLEPILEQADAVRVARSDLRWRDWQRYSNRQRSKMSLGGFVGEVTLEGPLEPFHDLLCTAEVVHVGKGATFGLGRVKVERDVTPLDPSVA